MSTAAEIYADFRQRGGVADLSARLKLRLTGEDRVRFLNGQVTAGVQRLSPGQALPACITTAKGRLCAEAVLHATADALFLDAEPSLRDSLPDRLERYIISDDVLLEDVTDELRLVHVAGGVAPASELFAAALLVDRTHRFGPNGWDVWLTPEAFDALWQQLAGRAAVLSPEIQEALRIEAGLPRWGFDLDENTLPPEAGLDRTHVDYHKGCYIGQEVISRLKSVGHVNRELTGFVAEAGAPLGAGAQLFPPDSDERTIGVLTSAAFSFALEKPIALGYLKRGAAFPELIARRADAAETRVAPHVLPFVS